MHVQYVRNLVEHCQVVGLISVIRRHITVSAMENA